MPINTFTCETCGARNNYVVEMNDVGEQEVKCSRCEATTMICYDDLPERLQETIGELEANNQAFASDMMINDSSNELDTVEETIKKVDGAFANAKQIMQAFDSKLMINTDISAIAEQYAPSDTGSKTTSKHSAEISDDASNESNRSTYKSRVRAAAKKKAREYARKKIKSEWDATDDEVDEIFNLADQLIDTCNANDLTVQDLITDYHDDLVNIIRQRIDDTELRDTLVQMIESGGFASLMKIATQIN